jgi:hypothetical protein
MNRTGDQTIMKTWLVIDNDEPHHTTIIVRAGSEESARRVVAAAVEEQKLRPLSDRAHYEELHRFGSEEVVFFDQLDASADPIPPRGRAR